MHKNQTSAILTLGDEYQVASLESKKIIRQESFLVNYMLQEKTCIHSVIVIILFTKEK